MHAIFDTYRRPLAALTLAVFTLTSVAPAFAGGYVDGSVVLNPAESINTGGVSVLPTFNNDQFNDQLLVGTVNNDPVKTPSTADPVSTVSGNNYHDETDFVIRGRNGLNMVFTRTYNSASSATSVDRGLGYGWTHSYLMRLQSNDFGDCPNCASTERPENANSKTSSITYTDERGGEQNYLVNETGFALTQPKGVYDTLTLDSPVAGQHTLAFRNGVKYIFEVPAGSLQTTPNLAARLKYIDNAWGDRLTLAYDVNDRLSTLTDNLAIAGRTGVVFTYDLDGRLKDVTDWTARKWSFGYDASGNLQSRTNPLTEVLTYTYDAPKHLLTAVVLPLTRDGLVVQTGFSYYQNGRTFQQTNSFGVGDTLDYDLYRKSTRVTDARGFVREYFYDADGRMTKLVEPDGGILLFENQGDAIRSKKYDAQGYATTYSYRADKAFTGVSDSAGNVTREQDALARTTDFTYGALDQIASVKDRRGAVSTATYAASTTATASVCGDYVNRPKEARISSLAGAANVLLASQCWNSNATLNSSRVYLDATRYRETRLTYQTGTNGLNVSQQQTVGMPAGTTVTQTYTYDALGRKKSETLKRRASPTDATLIDLTTTYVYDALDRVTQMTDVLGNEVANSYDANGALWKITHRYKKPLAGFDIRDVVTRTFDAAERLKTQTDAKDNVTSYQYDAAGNVIAVTDAENHTARIEYDSMRRRTAVIDATGYRTDTQYTLRGDVVSITNANNETVKFETDALGRQTAAIDPLGFRSEFQYDENGNLSCVIDANAQAGLQPKNTLGCSESRAYDERNRVTKITDAANNETVFSYDTPGNRLTVKDAELKTHSFAYDDLGRLKNETDHAGKVTRYQLDEAGNVYERTNRRADTTRITFDAASRPTQIDYLKDSSVETFSYDPAGNPETAANASVAYSFAWDRLNRLLTKVDGRGRTLNFTYDKAGNVLTKTTYQGSTTSYTYNAANRLVMLANPDYTQVDYQYDPAGRLLSRVAANGARTTRQYDANGWPTQLTQYDAANALISDTSYTRDRAGNIKTETTGASAISYTYDALYRLLFRGGSLIADETFSYDKVGNRKTYLTAGTTRYYSYTPGTNRLLDIRTGSTGGTVESSFTHDLEGRLTAQTGLGAKTLAWDSKNRVKTLTQSGVTETYTYDTSNHRIGRSGGALGSLDYFLEGEHLESIYSGANLQARYFRGSSTDELVAGYLYDTDAQLKPYLFHHDNVTSTTAVSGHNGGTIQSTTYGAFGNTQSSTGASPNRLKYTGREDDGTGLYYYRARYYDPQRGSFISEDPLGFRAGINFYAYVGNNPVNGNDPSGLDAYTLGGSFNFLGVGGSFGGFITFPGPKTKDNFDIGIFGSVTAPGFPLSTLIRETVNPDYPELPSSLNFGKLTIDVGYEWDGRASLSGTGVNYNAGLGLYGGAVNLQTPANDALPISGYQVNVGPQLRFGPEVSQTGTYSIGDIFQDIIFPVFDGVESLFSPSVPTVPNPQIPGSTSWIDDSFGYAGGGFLIYPNKANQNMTRSVYAK